MAGRLSRDDIVLGSLARFLYAEGLEASLDTPVVEAFAALGLRELSPPTKGTYRSVLRRLGQSERPQSAPGYRGSSAGRPYDENERRELLSMAQSQPKPWRRHSALAVLSLSLGAGLRSGELASVRGGDVTTGNCGVLVATAGRIVPVKGVYAGVLARLARTAGEEGHVFHPEPADRSYPNFVYDFCANLRRSPGTALLTVRRCRSSFVADRLGEAMSLSDLLSVTGIAEVESLIRYTRVLPGAPESKAALRRRLRPEAR
jgi:integrase